MIDNDTWGWRMRPITKFSPPPIRHRSPGTRAKRAWKLRRRGGEGGRR